MHRRFALRNEGCSLPSKKRNGMFCRKEGCHMVTYSDLIQIGILIVGIISLFISANKKK